MEISSVIKFLDERVRKLPPTQWIIGALELRLNCNDPGFNNTIYIQTDGTTQGPNNSCLYSDMAMTGHVNKALRYDSPPKVWKRFRDDVFIVWTHNTFKLPTFVDYLTLTIQELIIHLPNWRWRKWVRITQFQIKISNGKLSVNIYYKPTNYFAYVTPSSCYPMKKIDKVSQGIALRLHRICDTTGKYQSRACQWIQKLFISTWL